MRLIRLRLLNSYKGIKIFRADGIFTSCSRIAIDDLILGVKSGIGLLVGKLILTGGLTSNF